MLVNNGLDRMLMRTVVAYFKVLSFIQWRTEYNHKNSMKSMLQLKFEPSASIMQVTSVTAWTNLLGSFLLLSGTFERLRVSIIPFSEQFYLLDTLSYSRVKVNRYFWGAYSEFKSNNLILFFNSLVGVGLIPLGTSVIGGPIFATLDDRWPWSTSIMFLDIIHRLVFI
jgi:hypothetical protein